MEDAEIVRMYFARSEEAIACSRSKYGRMLYGVSMNILCVREDAEECENDTYLTAWNKIPPDEPTLLGAYLSKIVRFLSLNRLKKETADKRPRIADVEEELILCLPDAETPETVIENGCLKQTLDDFLKGLKRDDRVVFLRRYFYGEPIGGISARTGFSEGRIKMILYHTRIKLKKKLEKEGLL